MTLTSDAKKTILISVDLSELRVAVVEEGRTVEALIERRGQGSLAGNIYKGKIDNVLRGMEAAFVDLGLPRNGFLYVDDVVVPGQDPKTRRRRKIDELLKPGQEVLVQVVKDSMGTKGPRVTMELSIAGRFLVLSPHGEGSGVSRRLPDGERERLRKLAKSLEREDGGIIVRTAAAGATAEDLERDLRFLHKMWAQVEARAKPAKAGSLVYAEADLSLKVIRDLLARNVDEVLVDSERQYRRILGWVRTTQPEFVDRIKLYTDTVPLFERYGVDQAILSTLNRRVDLPSGGYLIFDYAEAFTDHRRQHGPVRRLVRAARGHDHAQQHRGGARGDAPAAAARHRRHHRDRLHRHGVGQEPHRGAERAPGRARARPHQDLPGRDLPARPRRDDPPERHGRRARDPHPHLPDLRRRGRRPERADDGGRGRAAAAQAGPRLGLRGLPRAAEREGRLGPRRPGRDEADRARERDRQAVHARAGRADAAERGRRDPRGHARRGQRLRGAGGRRRRAHACASPSRTCTTSPTVSPASTAATRWWSAGRSATSASSTRCASTGPPARPPTRRCSTPSRRRWTRLPSRTTTSCRSSSARWASGSSSRSAGPGRAARPRPSRARPRPRRPPRRRTRMRPTRDRGGAQAAAPLAGQAGRREGHRRGGRRAAGDRRRCRRRDAERRRRRRGCRRRGRRGGHGQPPPPARQARRPRPFEGGRRGRRRSRCRRR